MGRGPCCDKDGVKKGPWTPEEDQLLVQYIQKHGLGCWRSLPKNAGFFFFFFFGMFCFKVSEFIEPKLKFEEKTCVMALAWILEGKWPFLMLYYSKAMLFMPCYLLVDWNHA